MSFSLTTGLRTFGWIFSDDSLHAEFPIFPKVALVRSLIDRRLRLERETHGNSAE
jgi:hypothetical protein